MSKFTAAIKRLLPRGRAPRSIVLGAFKGVRLYLDPQTETLFWLGLYEWETHPALLRLAGGCSSFIDLGAGRGDLVCFFLRKYPQASVVAVEPGSIEELKSNVTLNCGQLPNRLTIWNGFAGAGAPATHRTLAQLAADLSGPVFIKIDIDGPEAAVVAESSEWVAKRNCRFLIETHSLDAERALTSQLESLGYRVNLIHPAWWRRFVPEHRVIPHNRWLTAAPH